MLMVSVTCSELLKWKDVKLKGTGVEAKIADLTPSGYATRSFPRASRGGGLAIIVRSRAAEYGFQILLHF